MRHKAAAIALSLAFYGCGTTKIHIDGETPPDAVMVEKNTTRFFWADNEVDARVLCDGRKIYRVERSATFGDALVSVVTLSLIAGEYTRVFCEPRGR